MTSKISLLTTCTIALATALTNLTPLEARAMEGSNFTSNQEEIHQEVSDGGSADTDGCIWVPGVGNVCN